ncbi:unnamed protein product [Cuscuta epithymum]|uniref:SHSP domain-containing protein n=1 Tax=Cuscuta epithymum TaxID=186058 RepID=A0AAV0CQS3_9ASTE|nr:unnamed protein product [Cuscuta epithymum]
MAGENQGRLPPPPYKYEDLTLEWRVDIGPKYDTLILHLPDGFTRDHVSIGVSTKGGSQEEEEKFINISGHKLDEGSNNKRLRFYKQFKVSTKCDVKRMYMRFENDKDLFIWQFKPLFEATDSHTAATMEQAFTVVDDVDPAAALTYIDQYNRMSFKKGVDGDKTHPEADTLTLHFPPGFQEDQVRIESNTSSPYILMTAHKQRRGERIYHLNEVYTPPSKLKGWVRLYSYLTGAFFDAYDMNRTEIKIEKGAAIVTLHKPIIPTNGSAQTSKMKDEDDNDHKKNVMAENLDDGPKRVVEKIEIMDDYEGDAAVETAATPEPHKEEPRTMRMTIMIILFAVGVAMLFVNKKTFYYLIINNIV